MHAGWNKWPQPSLRAAAGAGEGEAPQEASESSMLHRQMEHSVGGSAEISEHDTALVKAGMRRVAGFWRAISAPSCIAACSRAWLSALEGLVMQARDMPALRIVDFKRFLERARGALPDDSTKGHVTH